MLFLERVVAPRGSGGKESPSFCRCSRCSGVSFLAVSSRRRSSGPVSVFFGEEFGEGDVQCFDDAFDGFEGRLPPAVFDLLGGQPAEQGAGGIAARGARRRSLRREHYE